MQSTIVQTLTTSVSLTLKSPFGHVFQVRNHVKIYPWRFNRNNAECYLDTTRTPYTDKHNMNEFLNYKREKKPWMLVVPKDKDNRFNRYKWHEGYKSDPKEAKETAQQRLKRFQDSLRNRGHARESRAYEPPDDVQKRVFNVLSTVDGITLGTGASEDEMLALNLNQSRDLKFEVLRRCIEEFDHDLPNSFINDVETIADLIEYYSTPVRGISPYTALVNKSDALPPNLTLIPEAHRYDKDNDRMFNGISALPGNVSVVPGLRAAKKYPVLNQDEFQWPDI